MREVAGTDNVLKYVIERIDRFESIMQSNVRIVEEVREKIPEEFTLFVHGSDDSLIKFHHGVLAMFPKTIVETADDNSRRTRTYTVVGFLTTQIVRKLNELAVEVGVTKFDFLDF